MTKVLTSLKSGRQYGIELRERNYPKFEGRFNAYVEVYGELTGKFLGLIEEPLKMDVTPQDLPELANLIEAHIEKPFKYSNW